MTELMRIRVGWSGWSGGPGVTTFYASGTDVAPALTAIDTFFANLTTYVPAGIIFTTYGGGDIIEDSSGALTGQWQHQADKTHTCSGNGSYAAAAGGQIQLKTDKIHRGRRLAGRFFMVPLCSANFGGDGLITSTVATQLTTGAQNMITAANNTLCVWGRPLRVTGTGGTVNDGTNGSISSAVMPRKSVVLRSRRD